jgi:hypothetical protein
MRLQWLVALLVVGAFLVGCTQERTPVKQVQQPVAPTAQKGADLVDKALADMEKALGGTDKDALMQAANNVDLALGALTAQLSQKEVEAASEAHKVGKEAPASVLNQLGPARTASDNIMTAVTATPPDTNKAKAAILQIRSAVDGVRKALK